MCEFPILSPEGTADNSPRRKPWVGTPQIEAPERGDRALRRSFALSEGSPCLSAFPTAYAVGYCLSPPSEALKAKS